MRDTCQDFVELFLVQPRQYEIRRRIPGSLCLPAVLNKQSQRKNEIVREVSYCWLVMEIAAVGPFHSQLPIEDPTRQVDHIVSLTAHATFRAAGFIRYP